MLTLRATEFPIDAAESWAARLGGSGSRGDELTEITLHHDEGPDADPLGDDRARLVVITKRATSCELLREAREALLSWVRTDSGAARWPNASHAAITLSLRARERESRAAVLGAEGSERPLTIDGAPTGALRLEPVVDPAARLLRPEPPDDD